MTYSTEKMERVFNYFADKDDWKNPINLSISFAVMCDAGWSRELINKSIEHYTATTPKWSAIRHTEYGYPVEWNVKADGYRMGPAGDF